MDIQDYDFFLNLLKNNGTCLDETRFCFTDDPMRTERWLGYLPQRDKPYWVGGCDTPNGASYRTSEELMESPIFDGKSLRERWPQMRVLGAMGLGLEDWYGVYLECGGGPSPRGGPQSM